MANPTEHVSVPAVKPDPAPALAAAVPAAAKAGWLTTKTKVGIVVGGSVLSLVGGAYGLKSLGTGTPKAAAQSGKNTSVAVAQPATPDEPKKLPSELDILPPIRPVADRGARKDEFDLDLPTPGVKAPPNPGRRDDLIIDPPAISPPMPKLRGDADIESPLPAVTRTGTVTPSDKPLIIRTGGQGPAETAPPPLKTPIIEIDAPATVAPPKAGVTPPAPPAKAPIIDFDLPAPMAPTISPAPKVADLPLATPAPPVLKEEPPVVSPLTIGTGPTPKPPVLPADPAPPITITDPKLKPPVNLDPAPPIIDLTPAPTIGTPKPPVNLDPAPPLGAPKPPADAPKRDEFDEDWHTPKYGENYAMISREYYKSPDYAPALEAYNKDRRKGAENIVRVPPLWVLEEKFPAMTAAKADPRPAPATPMAPAPGGRSSGVDFDPPEGRSIGSSAPPSRPAPAPAVTPASNTNDEYRVQAANGETLREIAIKLYGDKMAMKRIWDMNPSVDPDIPIPAGTTLRLPR